ncbi:pre-mRNA-processing factor, putative [Entamoeba dispar SAW760]|uniref:Pre-mRNA-processing factor, putative n=1 Tax=Entamoeba dispar (strain ATCC PRA-260 / SAW760) TaxID=370354 RepID=B0E7Z0_ENTDS|nr:pre-mRNA-processing factor, putative [Entamoeba dispar SAW760]EDR29380.1 pre-mRNA-processing factor, putative [Entamoeba dispar SAW760]|eukprot:EDR29380.1 pre-mRNA-processing factor, putative [Entamoeba dispar SAW760]
MKSKAEKINNESIELEFQKAFKEQRKQKSKQKKKPIQNDFDQKQFDLLIQQEQAKRQLQKEETKKLVEEYSQLTAPCFGKGEMIIPDSISFGKEIRQVLKCKIPNNCTWDYNLNCKTLTSLCIHKEGNFLVCSGNDGIIRVCGLKEKSVVENLIGHQSMIPRVTFYDNFVISVSMDGTIKVWDIIKGEVITGWTEAPNSTDEKPPYKCLIANENGIFAGCTNKRIFQYDIREKKHTSEYIVDSIPLDVAHCGKGIVCSSEDKIIRYYDLGSGSVTKEIQDPNIQAMFCLNDYHGKYVIAQSMDNSIVCFRGDPFRQMSGRVFRGHYPGAWSCRPSFSPDGQYVLSGDANGKIFIWSWKKGKILKVFEHAHKGCVTDVIWHSTNDSSFISCGWDGNLCYWN